ncbi:ABC transporter permease [Clostridium sp. SYSU_GA19001]|uniref:ABC transporter permease n=1 Tax=Clostridium caldaquaticum TaxID=2940653 RepID=UPI00207794C1|nr:ABC transporter permease [Clostridium caldaquaticum]MCM8709979.1 ABC transporter permease [Clostridium caldaquaticum]
MSGKGQVVTTGKTMASEKSTGLFFRILKKYYLICVLILAIAVFGVASDKFLTVSNLTNVFVQNAYVIVATIGISLIMIAGGADLSVSYQISLVSIVTCILMLQVQLPVWLCVLLGIVTGALLGFINGYFSNILNVHTMVVTLGTMTIYQGIAYLISNSKSYFNLPISFKAIGQRYVFGIPICVIIMVVMVLIASFILNKTYFGRYIYAVGGNKEAARLAGINIEFISVAAFMIAGMFIAVAGIILTARTGSANAGMGGDAVFTCITGAVLGGISFAGGEGKISNVVVAVLILGVLANGMQLVGMGIYPQYVAKGIILLAAIGYDTYQKQIKVKKAQKAA